MMSMKHSVMLGAAIAAALVVGVAWWQPVQEQHGKARGGEADSSKPSASSVSHATAQRAMPVATTRSAVSYAAASTDGPDRATSARSAYSSATGADAVPRAVVAPDAARHLADALRYGDERSPPIVADAPPIERATDAELADPAAYHRYEQRSQAKLYRAFEQEAVIALNDIDRDIQRARAAGLSPEQIAEGEEKQRKLAETLERMRQGELGKD